LLQRMAAVDVLSRLQQPTVSRAAALAAMEHAQDEIRRDERLRRMIL
jgi:hypothetical protein